MDTTRERTNGAVKYQLSDRQKIYMPVKRSLDIVLSGIAVVLLGPVLGIISLAIKLESPGPVLFKQKRIGKDGELFEIWKFRSMRIDTPKDTPTHMLDDPNQYITKIGRFIRRTSLDELPQLFNILQGQMSIVGPRPALWNQYDLFVEREKYGVNSITPGLTGWAQINGRDELEIPIKAKFDGEYIEKMGLVMDVKCFLGTIGSVLRADGVVEGGTGEKGQKDSGRKGSLGSDTCRKDTDEKRNISVKHILITGAASYVGVSVENWLMEQPGRYRVTTVDMRTDTWKKMDFSVFDVVFHVAGIAHADVGAVTEQKKQMYYQVNTKLAVETAKKAKGSGVKQFIFMSSMIVYSGCKERMITRDTAPCPLNFYGDSKWQADRKIQTMESDGFKVVILRPPMIYGRGSKGNYPKLAEIASKCPVFPLIHNKRSMLYIDNLCEFVRLMIDNEETGVFFPQNDRYINTSELVQMISTIKGHKILMIPGMTAFIKIMSSIPGRIGELTTKAFGDSAYDMEMSGYKENYRVLGFLDSIKATEGEQ